MMLNAPYPADIRVKKEADALIAAGFEVHLLCLRKKGQQSDDRFEGIHVADGHGSALLRGRGLGAVG